MKFSRRGLIAGLAAASVALPAGYLGQREWNRRQEAELNSDEPPVPVADLPDALLAERLVGIWDFKVLDPSPRYSAFGPGLELLLEVGPGGRAVRGYLGRPPYTGQSMEVYGALDARTLPRLHWTLVASDGQSYNCALIFDEIWGVWSSGGGKATLSGQLQPAGVQAGHAGALRFVAVRRPFPLARERLPYVAHLHDELVSPKRRYFHQLWHASRDRWHRLSQERRQAVRALGWQVGVAGQERHARGHDRHRNGSGEDFLFMHRHMLHGVRRAQDLRSWRTLPAPRPPLAQGAQAFVDYLSNRDGYSVPPAWEAGADMHFAQWLHYIKSSQGFHANFQLWEAQLRDPAYLSTLCLGELGSRIELGIHDWLHMRWASIARDPDSGYPMPYARRNYDFAERWFGADNDFLGDPFSSHVNPVFWAFHGWIDDRLNDWYMAHQQAHPNEVRHKTVNGIPWFAPGPWVRVAEPWLGPSSEGCGAWGLSNGGGSETLDIETMKLALKVIFSPAEAFDRLAGRVPRRPWYARHLAPGPTLEHL